jgi:RNA polymerase sigma-70 factor (ECF subfamily)
VRAQQRFEAIYAEHASAVHRYAARRMTPGEAEDIVAEVFLIAWRRLEDVPADPRAWLVGVARRVAANARRGEDRRVALADRLAAEDRSATQETAGTARLGEALLSLSEPDREALTLIAWDGLSNREAAQVLGVRESTFGVRLLRARRRLQHALARQQSPTMNPTTPLEAR